MDNSGDQARDGVREPDQATHQHDGGHEGSTDDDEAVGESVVDVVGVVLHAIIIASQAAYATPSGDESGNISDIS